MKRYSRYLIIIVLLLSTGVYTYATPRAKYESSNMLSELDIPSEMPDWMSRDVSRSLDLQDEKYKFVSDVFARAYMNNIGERLLFLVLDAGNFHHPKVCFGSSGASIKDLPDVTFNAGGRSFKAQALYSEKAGEGTLVLYWICINKKTVDWTQQKMGQLWYSLFNKKKTGLMVRLDIPTSEDRISGSMGLAREFLNEISSKMPSDQLDYLFGA